MPKKYNFNDLLNMYKEVFGECELFYTDEFVDFLQVLIERGAYTRNLFWNFLKESSLYVPIDDIICRFNEYYSINGKVTQRKMHLKYGFCEGEKRWDVYREKQSNTNSFEYKNKKFGMSIDEYTEYNKSRAVTLDLCIKRHGYDIGTEFFKSYCEKQSYAGMKLEYFIEKYGEDIGRRKYNDVCISRQNSISYSKISQTFFWEIYNKIKHKVDSDQIFFGEHQREYFIYFDEQSKVFSYDFCIENLNLIIEFNGDFWHANPETHSPSEKLKVGRRKNMTALDIWKLDEIKTNAVKNLGFDVFVVWESDYKENPTKMLDLILGEIYDRIEKNKRLYT